MKTALEIKELNNFRGTAYLFKVNPPIEDYDDGHHHYVIVSQADVPYSGYETYIFPSDIEGNIVSWGELESSRRGEVTPRELLIELGYEIVETHL